jgi:hypothetical protein
VSTEDAVRQRFQLLVILSAWFMATGAQWDVVQTFGWTHMVINYSRTMGVVQAIQRTFSGEMCNICRAVNEAKQHEENTTAPGGKLEAETCGVFQPASPFIFPASETTRWRLADSEAVGAFRAAPPTPPPRA